jgi:hypothetical protein
MVLDPLSALSLAGNVVQFIDFTSSILSESRRIYQSGAESSDNIALESVADSLRDFSTRLKLKPPNEDASLLNGPDEKVFAVLGSCEEVASELLQAVQRVKPKDGLHRKWNSFRQALATVWQKEKLLGMQSRLSFIREQITLHIVSSVRWAPTLLPILHALLIVFGIVKNKTKYPRRYELWNKTSNL